MVLSDPNLRSNIRDFFTRVSAQLVKIQLHLRLFQNAFDHAQLEYLSDEERHTQQTIANNHLIEANKLCDRLREVKDRGAQLVGRL